MNGASANYGLRHQNLVIPYLSSRRMDAHREVQVLFCDSLLYRDSEALRHFTCFRTQIVESNHFPGHIWVVDSGYDLGVTVWAPIFVDLPF